MQSFKEFGMWLRNVIERLRGLGSAYVTVDWSQHIVEPRMVHFEGGDHIVTGALHEGQWHWYIDGEKFSIPAPVSA